MMQITMKIIFQSYVHNFREKQQLIELPDFIDFSHIKNILDVTYGNYKLPEFFNKVP